MSQFKAIQFKVDDRSDGPTGESKIIEADSHKEAVHKLYQEFKQEGPAFISPGDYVYLGEPMLPSEYRGVFWGVLTKPLDDGPVDELPEPPDPIELTSREINGRHPYRAPESPKFTGSVTPNRVRIDDDNNLDFWLEVELTREMKLMLLRDFLISNPEVNLVVYATEGMRLKVLQDIMEKFHAECPGEKMLLPDVVHFQEKKAKEEISVTP